MLQDLFRRLSDASADLAPLFKDLQNEGVGIDVMQLAMADYVANGPRVNGSASFVDVFLRSREEGLRVAPVFAGAAIVDKEDPDVTEQELERLESMPGWVQDRTELLAARVGELAHAFVHEGWSFVNGGGPGGMRLALRRLREAREAVGSESSKGLVVRSSLTTEPYCDLGDPGLVVRPQEHNEIREAMIAALGNLCDIALPGGFGTFFEAVEGGMRNYVAGRVPSGRLFRPIIVFDIRDDSLEGGSLWSPLEHQCRNFDVLGTAKGVEFGILRVFIEDDDCVETAMEHILNFHRHSSDVETVV